MQCGGSVSNNKRSNERREIMRQFNGIIKEIKIGEIKKYDYQKVERDNYDCHI